MRDENGEEAPMAGRSFHYWHASEAHCISDETSEDLIFSGTCYPEGRLFILMTIVDSMHYISMCQLSECSYKLGILYSIQNYGIKSCAANIMSASIGQVRLEVVVRQRKASFKITLLWFSNQMVHTFHMICKCQGSLGEMEGRCANRWKVSPVWQR